MIQPSIVAHGVPLPAEQAAEQTALASDIQTFQDSSVTHGTAALIRSRHAAHTALRQRVNSHLSTTLTTSLPAAITAADATIASTKADVVRRLSTNKTLGPFLESVIPANKAAADANLALGKELLLERSQGLGFDDADLDTIASLHPTVRAAQAARDTLDTAAPSLQGAIVNNASAITKLQTQLSLLANAPDTNIVHYDGVGATGE